MEKTDHKTVIIFVIVIFSVLISFIAYQVAHPWGLDYFINNRSPMEELTITNLDFIYGDSTTGQIIISTINSGGVDLTVSEIKVNNETASSWEATNSATLNKGATETFTITQSITAGTKYKVHLFSAKYGQIVGSYTKTA